MSKNEDGNFFDIDLDQLDEEWLNQSKIYHDHALLLAQARAEYDQAKAELELVTAELDRSIRSNPGEYDIGKLTEGSVEKAIIVQEEYNKANKRVLRTKYNMEVAQAGVNALDHKKKALEKLVDLRLSDYWSEPRARSPKSREHMEELDKDRVRRKALEKHQHRKEQQ